MEKNPFQVQRAIYILFILSSAIYLTFNFLIPVMLASTIALSLYPIQSRLEFKGWKKKYAASFLTILFTLLISIPFILFVSKGVRVLIEQLDKYTKSGDFSDVGFQKVMMTLRKDIILRIMNSLEKLPFGQVMNEQMINNYLKSFSSWLLNFFQGFLTGLPGITLFLVIMIFTTYSMLKNADHIKNFFQKIFGLNNQDMGELVFAFQSDARQVYVSNFLTGVIQSIIVATGVALIIDADWFLVFFITLIFSFIPVIGAAPMAFLFSIVAFFQGETSGAIILLVVGGFAGLIDNLLRPWLTTFGKTKAPPIVSFICVVGGAVTLGFPGLFLGLLLASIAFDTLPLFWRHLLKTRSVHLD
jgi:predicted PurR-regulated permease PerM